MDIVIGNPEHISVISHIACESWAVTYKDILSPDQMQYMLDMMYSESSLIEQMTKLNHHFFLIKRMDSNTFQGFVSCEFNYKESQKTKLHKLYLLPECQGAGMGRLLIEKVKTEAARNRNIAVNLNMNRYNKTKIFYERMGFRIVGEEDIDIGNGYLMEDYIFEMDI